MEIVTNDSAAQDSVDDIAKGAENMTQALTEIGWLLVDSAHANINAEGRPAWVPAARDYGHSLLFDTGTLYHGVYWAIMGTDSVKVDDAVSYAVWQHGGTDRIPARPFLYAQPDDLKEIDEIFAKHLMG